MAILSCLVVVLVLNTWFAVTSLMSLFLAFNSDMPPALFGFLEKFHIKTSLDGLFVNKVKKGRHL